MMAVAEPPMQLPVISTLIPVTDVHSPPDSIPKRPLYRYLLPVALILVSGWLFRSGIDANRLRGWLDEAGPAAPVGFIAVGVLLMSLFVPKTAMSVSAGMLFGTWIGGCLLTVTAVSAASLNYAIGRCWLHDWLRERLSRQPESLLSELHRVAAKAGLGLHLLFRLSPAPTTVISYTMGASGARFRPFITAAFLGAMPQWLWVYSGAATMRASTSSGWTRWYSVTISVTAALLVSFFVSQTARRRLSIKPIEKPMPPA